MADDFSPHADQRIDSALDAAEAEEVRKLLAAMLALRDAYADMTVAQAAALLLTASSPSAVSMTDIRRSVGVAASTATRAVLTLSSMPRGAGAVPGPGLVEQTVDPRDKRWRLTRCTPKGFGVVREVVDAAR